MYTDEDLNLAVAEGIVSAEAVAAVRAHVMGRRSVANYADDEHFRLLTGFNDVFVVIASALLLLSVGWMGHRLAPWAGALAVSVTSWSLAEFFVRVRRMALMAIVLLLSFFGGIVVTILSIGLGTGSVAQGVVVAAGTAVAAHLHWRRFHVPITVAAAACVMTATLIKVAIGLLPWLSESVSGLVLVAGLVAFVLALRWDASDPQRNTRRTDVAFWLHLVAAPLLVHSVFTMLGLANSNGVGVRTMAVLLLYVLLALVSLAIDRRALMVSALGYVLYAFSSLLNHAGLVGMGFAVTALLIGGALLVLSAFWHRSREALVSHLPSALQARLAPIH